MSKRKSIAELDAGGIAVQDCLSAKRVTKTDSEDNLAETRPVKSVGEVPQAESLAELPEPEELVSVKRIAKLIGLCPDTVRMMARTHRIPCFKGMGKNSRYRFRASEVLATMRRSA